MAEHKIRYIIGAGASANKISPVEGFSTLISAWKHRFEDATVRSTNDDYRIISQYLKGMEKLTKETFSVDTLARMYSIRGAKTELVKLKTAITLLLNFEQRLKGNDIRYDLFLSSLLSSNGGKLSFPSNIQIVSWNYDFQLELALSKILNVKQSIESFTSTFGPNQLVKVNGTSLCEFTELLPQPDDEFHSSWMNKESEFIAKVSMSMNHPRNPLGGIKFAWEHADNLNDVNEFQPDVTVVIGYSFPIFNREIDMILLAPATELGHKVYIQCNNAEGEGNNDVRSKLQGMNVKDVEAVSSSREFFVPYEFNLPKEDPYSGIGIHFID